MSKASKPRAKRPIRKADPRQQIACPEERVPLAVERVVCPPAVGGAAATLADLMGYMRNPDGLRDGIQQKAERAFDLAHKLEYAVAGVLSPGALRADLEKVLAEMRELFEHLRDRDLKGVRRMRGCVAKAEQRSDGDDVKEFKAAVDGVTDAYQSWVKLHKRAADAEDAGKRKCYGEVVELVSDVLQWCAARPGAMSERPGDREAVAEAMRRIEESADELGNGQSSSRERTQDARQKKPRGESDRRPSWTQATVDGEIRRLIEAHKRKLTQLGKAVREKIPGAVENWRTFFGRNTLAKKLQCSGAMISESKPWNVLAEPLGLRGRSPGVGRGERVGSDMAEERAAVGREPERKKAQEDTDAAMDRDLEVKRLQAEQQVEDAADERAAKRRRRA